MKSNLLLVLLFSLLFSSCSSLMNLSEVFVSEVPKEKREKIEKMISEIKGKKAKSLKKSGQSLLRIRKGQWVTTLTTDKKKSKDLTLTKTKIIKATKSKLIMEMETYRASNDAKMEITQVTFSGFPLKGKIIYDKEEIEKTMDNIEILRVVNVDHEGKKHEMPQQSLAIMKGATTSFLKNRVSIDKAVRKKCQTTYLKSSRCYHYKTAMSIMGMTINSDIVAHSKVPINGQVVQETEQLKIETIAFGFKGAKSKIK